MLLGMLSSSTDHSNLEGSACVLQKTLKCRSNSEEDDVGFKLTGPNATDVAYGATLVRKIC